MNPSYPSKEEFMVAFESLSFSPEINSLVPSAYDRALNAHIHAPKRASGEVYFWHPYSCALEVIEIQKALLIPDWRWIVDMLLHDTVEDAKKNKSDPRVVLSDITRFVDPECGYDVSLMTKHENISANSAKIAVSEKLRKDLALFQMAYEYPHHEPPHEVVNQKLVRDVVFYKKLFGGRSWRSLAGKSVDRGNNLKTLRYIQPVGKQLSKIEETRRYYPELHRVLKQVIYREIECGRLIGDGWKKLPRLLQARLMSQLRKEESRLCLR